MSAEKDKMVAALKEKVVPRLKLLGFKGSFPHFRRILNGRLNLLSFQFDKWRGGFIIEIANCNPSGITTPWGKEIKANKVTVYDLFERKRIYADMTRDNGSIDNWYRYDRTSLNDYINVYESLCDDVLNNMSFALEYWGNGKMN